MNRNRLSHLLSKRIHLPIYWVDLAFVLILGLALFLRLGPFIHKDLWQDELYSIHFASENYSPVLQLLNPVDDRPPLFYLLVRAQLFFSHDKILLRLPSLLSSLLTSFIFFVMLRKRHPGVALTGSLFSAFSPFLIHYSWQLRDYGLMLSITATGIFVMYQQLQSIEHGQRVRWRSLALFAATSLVGSLLNYIYFVYSLILIGLIGVVGFVAFQQHRKVFLDYVSRLVLIHFPIFSLILQYLLIQRETITNTTSWIPPFSFFSLAGLMSTAFGLSYAFDVVMPEQYVRLGVKSIISLLVLLIGMVVFFHRRRRYKTSFTVLMVLSFLTFGCTVIAMIILGSLTGTSLFLNRTFVPVTVFLILGMGVLVHEIFRTLAKKWLALFFVVSILGSIYVHQNIDRYLTRYPMVIGDFTHENHQSYTDAAEVIREEMDADTQLIVIPYGLQPLVMDYYFHDKPDMDRLSVFLQTKVTNDDVPIPHVRPHIPISKVILVTASVFFNQDRSDVFFTDDYIMQNKKIRQYLNEICYEKLREVRVTSQHVIESCRVRPPTGLGN